MVLGFSFTGSWIPAGSGTLVELEFENGGEPCIDPASLVLSDTWGQALTELLMAV
jgi:hypothetical protein